MYFPYPDKSSPQLQGVGAYHVAKTSAPVATTRLGAVPVSGFGRLPTIRSPWFVQSTPYPYIKGPNYTRPVFREHSRKGAFVAQPIVRMPSLKGFGQDPEPPVGMPDPFGGGGGPGGEADAHLPTPAATPLTVCEAVKPYPGPYERCLKFNERYLTGTPEAIAAMNAKVQSASAACADKNEFSEWSDCFYSTLEGAWYENPLYLGGAVFAGCAALGLVILALRRTSEE